MSPSRVANAGVQRPVSLDGNRLLDGLPSSELSSIRSSAERVRPRMRQLLYEQDEPARSVYFPQSGVFSLLAEMSNGSVLETLTVGREGMVGLPFVLGAKRSPTRVICQVSGWSLRVPLDAILEAAPRSERLFNRITRYSNARLTALSRSVACSRLHSAQHRYARWVLTVQDRVAMDEFPITQDFLAQMLGVTRPTISLVGRELQSLGLIHYSQGRLTVDDRAGLEGVSCECYGVIRRAYDAMHGPARQE